MEKSRSVSFRLQNSTIERLDDAVKNLQWWKRNAVVEQLLLFALTKISERDLFDIVRSDYNGRYKCFVDSVDIHFNSKS